MSRIDVLRSLVSERLAAAAEEILGAFERTIAEYEEELERQRRLLDVALKPPKSTLNTIGFVQLSDQQHCEQERSPSLVQEDPESPRFKEEQQELGISPQEDQPPLQEPADTSESIFTPLCGGNNHDKDQPLPLLLDQTQIEGDREPPAVNSYKLTQTDDKDDNFVESELRSDHHTRFNCCCVTKSEADHTHSCKNFEEAYEEETDRQRRLLDITLKPQIRLHRIDLLLPSAQQYCEQEKSPSLSQKDPESLYPKEEQQELGISPQEDTLPLQVAADTSESIFTPVCDGNDHGKDQPLPLLLYQTQIEGDREPPAVNSNKLTQMDDKDDNFVKSEPISDHHTLFNSCHVTKSEADHTYSRKNREEAINQQKRLLDIALKPRIKLLRIDFFPPSAQQHCEQEQSPSLSQKGPESPYIKEEQQELGISPQEDHLPLQEAADITESISTPMCDGNDHGKDQPLPLLLYQTQIEGDREPPAVNSYKLTQMDDKDDNFVKSEPTSDHHTLFNSCHVTKSEADHTYSRKNCEEAIDQQKRQLEIALKPRIKLLRIDFLPPSAQQQCEQKKSPSLSQKGPESPYIKEEQQELGISPQEDHLPLQEAADTTESIFSPLCNGNDHGKDQPVPWQPYHTKCEGDTEPPAVSSYEQIQPDDKEDNFVISEPTSDHHTLSNCCHVTKSEADHTYSRHICEEANEEEIDRQRRLLDNVLKPQIMLHRIDFCQQSDQHLKQERSPNLGQEDPEPPHIKEEQQELRIDQQEDQIQLQEKTDISGSIFNPLCDGRVLSKGQYLPLHPLASLTRSVTETPTRTSSELTQSDANEDGFPITELTSTCQPPSRHCHVAKTSSCGNRKDAVLTQRTVLKPHKKLHNCHRCGKECTNSTNLKRHMRIHTGEKPFKCTVCAKMFRQKAHLQKHVRTHTGEKPFWCQVCKKRFSSNWHLKQHFMIHTGEKPYRCDHCEKQFSDNSSFTNHLRNHTGEKPYQCNICGKKFSIKSVLKMHMRIHTGGKPYKCPTCWKSFTYKANLKVHIRMHTGEKPYKCIYCGKRFSRSLGVRTHMTLHTGVPH